jgi:hypothetical protein
MEGDRQPDKIPLSMRKRVLRCAASAISVPVRRRGSRKRIVAPDGSEIVPTAEPSRTAAVDPDEAIGGHERDEWQWRGRPRRAP